MYFPYKKPNTSPQPPDLLWLSVISLKPQQEFAKHISRKFHHSELQTGLSPRSSSHTHFIYFRLKISPWQKKKKRQVASILYTWCLSTCCTLIFTVPTISYLCCPEIHLIAWRCSRICPWPCAPCNGYLCANLAKRRCPIVWSNTSHNVPGKVCFR